MSENAENPAINDENKIPVNIITGFLGSGKTTLLNHWVNSEEFKDTLVLINEFGDVGLDHELVESVDSSVVLLQSGCICCSLQGALVDSLATNFIKAQRGEIPNFKRVIIETTGLADPSGVIGTLNGDDFLLDHYYHDGTITVLDGMFVRDQLKKQYEAVKQIALADIVIVSKTDLIESDELDAIYEITAKINPAAKVFPAVKGNISPKILFDIGPYKNADQAFDKKVTSWLNFKSPNLASSIRPATVNSTIGVSKPKIIAHSDIDSFCMEFDQPIEALALLSGISTVQEQYGDSILRIKGIIDLKDQEKPIVIHGVQGNLYPLSELHSWPNGQRHSQLVFICRASVMDQIKHMFKQIMENPDSAAISYYQQMIDGIERADDY
ncbi:CobW family GTP-binding protein [Succinivibrio dextrinosolvens]|jgi:G3E family GTPase|uniref:CobW family GTP-binding protein n=1 Tax=Succinivibrio dextrinosolvens TaxID=83771 RepID=UPI00068A0274|nr:GTP-binding protein [Succinivibrio dextrinosolvens]MBE6423761.1 GTP-binding protein [Succinivibrio dextrinosolvens]